MKGAFDSLFFPPLAWLIAVPALLACGCTGLPIAKTQVLSEVAAPAASIQTATVVYQSSNKNGAVKTLAIQYPHPDGRRDVGLAELVVGEQEVSQLSPRQSWRSRIATWCNDALPGVSMGDGVLVAQSEELPRRQIEQLVSELSKQQDIRTVAHMEDGTYVQIVVDGRTIPHGPVNNSLLERLARRVGTRGSVVTHTDPVPRLLGTAASTVTSVKKTALQPKPIDASLRRLPPI